MAAAHNPAREGGETPVTGGHVEDEIPYLESGRRDDCDDGGAAAHSLTLSLSLPA